MAQYLIIGNGVAGASAAESIRKYDNRGNITIVTDESLPFYYRIRLNEYISGDIGQDVLMAKKGSWYMDNNIGLMLDTRVTGADPVVKHVITESGETISYDRLLIATGSHSFIPPINGSQINGVFAIRDIRDAERIMEYSRNITDAVVIGGGLLGLEAANALRKMGKSVTVVEFAPRLLPRQLDVEGAKRLQAIMETMGLSFRLDAKTEAIEGGEEVKAVRLAGGETLPARMVIISAGVRPNMELAKALGLDCDKGIKINGHLSTNKLDIFAAGDCAEFNGISYGIWPAAMEQGKVAGANMAGEDIVYTGTTMSNTLKVAGIDLASSGNIDTDNKYESKIKMDDKSYKKVVLEDGRIIGCIMLGDTKVFPKITKLISSKIDVSKFKDKILDEGFDFGKL
ncbi:MAG: NAD(P)/FAD-dependent oxidoreductase [Deltaproteobacteria bacterium]|nr:NAD(P)/FAD-dependent oxidoreductase [Deltaproteobacteria bacterium]